MDPALRESVLAPGVASTLQSDAYLLLGGEGGFFFWGRRGGGLFLSKWSGEGSPTAENDAGQSVRAHKESSALEARAHT